MPSKVRLGGVGTKLILVLFGCLAGFLLGEVALRVIFPGYVPSAGIERNFFCQFDGEIGWVPLPNISGQHQRHGFSAFVHQNQFGLRGPNSMAREKNSTRKRTLVLGDSYVWGYGVDQQWVFTEPNVHHSETELINFGVSGYGTDQEYLLYLREGVLFDVDEVVLVVTPYNDVENNLADEQYRHVKPYFTQSDDRLVLHTDHIHENKVQSVINWIWAHSRVINVVDRANRTFQNWMLIRNSDGAATPHAGLLSPEAVSSRDQEGIQLTFHIITALRDAVQKTGARFSVAFVPYKPHILNHVPHNHPLVPLLAKRLTEANIDYYEPYFIFLENAAGASLYNSLDNHFSGHGHAVFGRVFVDSGTREKTKNRYSAAGGSGRQLGRN